MTTRQPLDAPQTRAAFAAITARFRKARVSAAVDPRSIARLIARIRSSGSNVQLPEVIHRQARVDVHRSTNIQAVVAFANAHPAIEAAMIVCPAPTPANASA